MVKGASDETEVFEYAVTGPRILWGRGSMSLLGQELSRAAGSRALIVCGRSVERSTWFQSLRDQLGKRCAGVFGEVTPHTPAETIRNGVIAARAVSPDCLVTIGGGSVHDAGKLIALSLVEGDDLDAYRVKWLDGRRLHIPTLSKPKLPLIAVPTTLSAAEVIGAAAYVTGGKRYVIVDPAILPRAVVYDSEIAATTPIEIFLGTGINAIAHCIEAVYSRKAQPISEALALGALRLLMQSLAACAAQPGNLSARQQAQVGACMSGLAYSNTWLGIAHALCQALGARHLVPQGFLHAVMLPHAMRFNLPATETKHKLLAGVMSDAVQDRVPATTPYDAIRIIEQFVAGLDLPQRLRDLAIPEAGLKAVAEDSFEVWHTHFNPRRVESAAELLEVLAQAW